MLTAMLVHPPLHLAWHCAVVNPWPSRVGPSSCPGRPGQKASDVLFQVRAPTHWSTSRLVLPRAAASLYLKKQEENKGRIVFALSAGPATCPAWGLQVAYYVNDTGWLVATTCS